MRRVICDDDKEGHVIEPRDRLIVALDVPSVADAEALVTRLGDAVSFYKIGYQLAFAGGLPLAEKLARSGKQVFLDLKLHDIGNTVAKGVESVVKLGATFLTVHAYPQTMKAAVAARGSSNLRILAVTVLTSYDDADLAAAGYDFTVEELVAERAAQARDRGVDGIVCSAAEAASLRGIVGHGMTLVTPGIRPAGSDTGDQKRIMTPAAAIAAGADHLVVGRPILAAADPKAAAAAIVAEIAAAQGKKGSDEWPRDIGSPMST
jgi:orotidine-5'-phosphate decarboxylase